MNRVYGYNRPNIFFVILFFATLTLIARIVAKPHGPHGGTVQKAGEYYIEMKTPEKKFYAYLLDKKFKTISNKDLSGNARFFFPDSTTFDIPLKPAEENAFTCLVPGNFYACNITFNFMGNSISAKFSNPKQIVLNEGK
jgi:hypothetical protein